ncbi:MAG: hypothetical protein ABIH71_05715, partial [Candidatus Omnitrophota bacterium]
MEILATIDNFRTIARKTRGELLSPTVGYDCQNIRFDEEVGSFEKRYPRAIYSTMSTLGTSRVIFIDRFYKSSTNAKELICAYSTFLKKGNDFTGAFTNIKTGLTTGLRWNSLTFKNFWYGCNGTDSPVVYDLSNVETMGVPVAAAPSGADSGIAGNPNGAYKYKVSYIVSGYQEGNASVASGTVTVSSKKITVTIPVSTDTRVTARYLYRTQASGSIYYFCAEISNNVDVTYTDNIADGSLSTTIIAPSDNAVPSAFKYMCLHKSRIFGSRISGNLSRTIYSHIGSGISYPDIFPADNFFDVLKDNGEDTTGIHEDNFGQLIVFKPSAVIKINTENDDPVSWSGFTNILSVNGCIAPYSTAKTHIGLIYLTRYAKRKKRLMRWTGAAAEPIFEELEPILSNIPESRVYDMVGKYHNGAYYLAYTDPDSGNSYNDRELIINLNSGTYTIDKKNIDCFSTWNSGIVGTTGGDEGELYSGTSDTTGYIYREDTDIEDWAIRYKSEVDLGTLDDALTSAGTETVPTLGLNTDVTTQVGAQIVSTVSSIVNTLTGEQDYVFPSGLYTSAIVEKNARVFRNIYWTEQLGTYGKIHFYVRTGGTSAACAAASWNGPYTTSGSDISAVTANRYVQFKVKLFIHGTYASQYATVYLERGASPVDYVVRISFGLGTKVLDAIEMFYTSEWLDFGWLMPELKRVRKHFHRVRIDFERSTATGTLVFGYYLNNSASITEQTFNFSDWASKGYCVYQFPYGTLAKNIR